MVPSAVFKCCSSLVKRRPSSSKENSRRTAKMILLVKSPLLFLTRRSPRPCPRQASPHFFWREPSLRNRRISFRLCSPEIRKKLLYALLSVLVPKDRARFGQPQKLRALNESCNTGSPRFMRGLPVQSSLTNLIG